MDDIKVFPIIISKNNESSDYPYFVEIPDIDGMTEGQALLTRWKWRRTILAPTL